MKIGLDAYTIREMKLSPFGMLDYAEKRIAENNRVELRRNLQTVMDQNVETMSLIMDRYKTAVSRVAMHIQNSSFTPSEIKNIVERQNNVKQAIHFIRVGFIYPDGTVIASDGAQGNLSIREYFQRSMRGEVVFTPAMRNYLGDVHIPSNVCSMPVYDHNNNIAGVAFATIPNSLIVDVISRGTFAEFGSSALVDNNGEIIAANRDSSFHDIDGDLLGFVTLESTDRHLTTWQRRLTENASSTMYFERNGGKYLYYAPLRLYNQQPVHIATLLNKTTLEAQTSHFTKEIHSIMLALLALSTLGAAYFIWDTHRQETKRRKSLEHTAYTSDTTDSYNYAYFKNQLSITQLDGYVAYMDIREFDIITSSSSPGTSNELLKKVWQCLSSTIHPQDIAAHISNSYFAIFLANYDLDRVTSVLNDINDNLQEMTKAENLPPLVAFWGLAPFHAGENVESIFANASIAHQSIIGDKNTPYAFYGEKFTLEYINNSQLERNFDEYLRDNCFEVWYQPKYDCYTNTIMGAEALVRLRSKDGHLISPAKFIPLFERDGLIRILDEHVFETVCKQQKRLLKEGKPLVPISINLSRTSLYAGSMAESYARIITTLRIPVECVPIEITETAMVHSETARQRIYEFHRLGFKLHLDDFGSGYSSLALLNELHFDNIKIDKSLIDYIGEPRGNNLLKHVIALSKELGMSVTAEGVEREYQIDFLKSLNCHCIQGYYYSPPLQCKDFLALLYKEK